MKVAILCGGKGTRLGPVAEEVPKPMLKIGGTPILEHIIRIYKHFNYDEFVLLLGYKGKIIENYFKERHPDWKIQFKYTGKNAKTGERIIKAKDLLGDTFFLTYGDGLADINIKKLSEYHRNNSGIATVTVVNLPSQFGVLNLNGNKVKSFIEKPILLEYWINGGFFVFDKEIFEYKFKNLERELLPMLTEEGLLNGYKHNGFWRCMDHFKDHSTLNELYSNGNADWAIWRKRK